MAKKIEQVGLRLTDEELIRLDGVVERVRTRNPHMDRSKVMREVIGFDATNFVTEEDRLHLRAKALGESAEGDPPERSKSQVPA